MRIGILTSGGDCPGLNAAIRGVGKTAMMKYGMNVVGISSGFLGLIEGEARELTEETLSGILTLGGTILGTSREKPFKKKGSDDTADDKPKIIKKNYRNMGLDAVMCIGGNGTMKTAHRLAGEGLNVIGIPKTIDNDVYGTDLSFGFDSAVSIVTEAIDRLHTTANSHRRTMVVEVMGHHAGWIALHAGIAGGGDLILIPEIPYSEQKMLRYITARVKYGKPYSIVIVAEGIAVPDSHRKMSPGTYIANRIGDLTGGEARETILGYVQRGGTPSAADRILATRFGAYAAELAHQKKFGVMVAIRNDEMKSVPLSSVAGKLKTVPKDHTLVRTARMLGASFGDE